jgi:transglutaminase-like putative cysteine protease
MGIQVALNHRTLYRYEKAISLGPQVIQLRPALHCRTPILSYSLDVTPSEHILNWQLDPHNNRLARLLFSGKTSELLVEVNLVADLSPYNPFEFFLEPGVEEYPFAYAPGLAKDLEPYRSVDPPGPLLHAFLESFVGRKSGTISLLLDLNRKVRDEIGYVVEAGARRPDVRGDPREALGSCRDSAWLLVQSLRNLGIAARFVSGYLIQLQSPDPASGGPEADSADLHAWAEAFLPGAGWIGMDPTSGLLAGEGHIPLVCTPTASQAAPIGGTSEPAKVEFSHSIAIRRLNDPRRPSKPFTDEDWLRIRQVAHSVDEELKAQDVRLTMGGEPTYVGIDDPESPQWNIDAAGSMKRTRGLALIQGLREGWRPADFSTTGKANGTPARPCRVGR